MCQVLTATCPIVRSSSTKYPGGNKDNAKLLRLVEQQLVDSADDDNDLDLQLAWRTFSQGDKARRNMLSRDQVTHVPYPHLPLHLYPCSSTLNRRS